MKNLLLATVILFFSLFSKAQITLDHAFVMTSNVVSEVVNLSLSGKKIMILNLNQPFTPDTLYFYNMDYSFWKSIVIPYITGYTIPAVNIYTSVTLFYPSETLFNTDSLLEVAVMYNIPAPPYDEGTIFIINENNVLVDSITNVEVIGQQFQVFEAFPGVFKAIVATPTGINYYNLPGTIPCSICGNALGLANESKPTNISTQPLPNPSSNEVKITFTLPDGANRGELNLYNSTGQKIKTCQVDNRFGFIMLDNTQLPAGMYYYNIVVNGEVSTTQKMVLVK